MAKNEITMNITTDLHSLVKIDCLHLKCKYHQRHTLNCNLKYIVVSVNGVCTSCEEEDYEQ